MLAGGSQCSPVWKTGTIILVTIRGGSPEERLNVVRSGRPEQSLLGVIRQIAKVGCLNVVRSGRPEQCQHRIERCEKGNWSQCSPVWKTGTISLGCPLSSGSSRWSQCSPVWKTGTIKSRQIMGEEKLRSQCSPVWKTGTMGAAVSSGSCGCRVVSM